MADLDLTKRQQEIVDFIKKYSAKYGYPPTVRDIGKAIGLTSSSTVHAHLANLEKVGLLRRDPTKPRAIELLVDKAKRAVTGGHPRRRPGGRRRAGAGRGERGRVRPDPVARGRRRRRVHPFRRGRLDDRGRASTTATTSSCARQDTARNGEIVVALVGRRRRHGQALLQGVRPRAAPARERAMEPIRSSEVKVLGKVVGVLRRVHMSSAVVSRPRRLRGSHLHDRQNGRRSRRPRSVRWRWAHARAAARRRLGGPARRRGGRMPRVPCAHAAGTGGGELPLRRLRLHPLLNRSAVSAQPLAAAAPGAYHWLAGQAAAGVGEKTGVRGKSGHRRARWSGDRPGETRGKVPQKHTA